MTSIDEVLGLLLAMNRHLAALLIDALVATAFNGLAFFAGVAIATAVLMIVNRIHRRRSAYRHDTVEDPFISKPTLMFTFTCANTTSGFERKTGSARFSRSKVWPDEMGAKNEWRGRKPCYRSDIPYYTYFQPSCNPQILRANLAADSYCCIPTMPREALVQQTALGLVVGHSEAKKHSSAKSVFSCHRHHSAAFKAEHAWSGRRLHFWCDTAQRPTDQDPANTKKRHHRNKSFAKGGRTGSLATEVMPKGHREDSVLSRDVNKRFHGPQQMTLVECRNGDRDRRIALAHGARRRKARSTHIRVHLEAYLFN